MQVVPPTRLPSYIVEGNIAHSYTNGCSRLPQALGTQQLLSSAINPVTRMDVQPDSNSLEVPKGTTLATDNWSLFGPCDAGQRVPWVVLRVHL